MNIKWRTNTSTSSKVWYGPSPTNLPFTATVNGSYTDHEVKVTGLAPNTVYYYAVGNSSGQLTQPSANHYFKTSPNPGTVQTIRTWVLGDCGTGDNNQRSVRDAFYNFNGSQHIDMILLLGDNAYDDGTDAEFQAAFFENMYEDRLINTVMWPAIGNHETVTADSPTESGPYYEIFTMPRNGEAGGVPSGTEAYYSFDYGNIHFVVLDSDDSGRNPGDPQLVWLENDLSNTDQDWIVAYWHHPPYSKSGESDTNSKERKMRENILPILESHSVDLVLVGHSHNWQRSYLINGHYGLQNTWNPATMGIDLGDGRPNGDGAYTQNTLGQGTVYLVTGSAGKKTGSITDPHPVMYHSQADYGSMYMEVTGGQMDIKFIRDNGNIDDYFSIVKNVATGSPPTVSVTSPANGFNYTSPQSVTITADASDSDGSVTQVEFFINNISIGTDNQAPYSVNYNIPDEGTYIITATALDDDDNVAQSDPVEFTVGPVTVCVHIDNSSDDVEQRLDNGSADLTNGDLELIRDGTRDQVVGLRFNNLNIPQGANIASAYIQFTVDEETNLNPCNLSISGVDADNPGTFTDSDDNVSNLPKTSASVSWTPSNWLAKGDRGPAQQTPNIATVIQEIVNRPGFSSVSSIALLIEGEGARVAESFDGASSPDLAPELCIEWSTAPINYDCPNLLANIGSPCDDGDNTTLNDMVNANCECAGTATACTGIGDDDGDGVCADVDCDDLDPDVTHRPGDACDDGNLATINDMYDANCNCTGTFNTCDGIGDNDGDGICSDIDCNDNDPNSTSIAGDPCDDGDNTTINDTYDANCNCVGTPTACTGIGDADGDGVCADVDCDDNDPNNTGYPGAACDDGIPTTSGETIQADCSCGGGVTGQASVCVRVNLGTDDVEERSTGHVNESSVDLEIVDDGPNGLVTIGLRFTGLNITPGATIDNAYIQFTADETTVINPCNLTIYGHDSDDAPTFVGGVSFDASGRPRTSNTIAWNPPDWTNVGDAGPAQRTPDISSIIQEIVDRPGFTASSSIAITIDGIGLRVADSYEGGPDKAPQLCVSFSVDDPDCPSLSADIGDPCNDGDNTTINDVVDANCNCVGTPTACTGIGDADGDGICADIDCDDNNASITSVDADGDGFCSNVDCDDTNPNIHPGAQETCDGIDNDCDNLVDDADNSVSGQSTFYADNDNDGFGDPGNTTQACSVPSGYVADNTDCDDNDDKAFPGQTWYLDADGDGYGTGASQSACTRPANHYAAAELTATSGDCNDANAAVHPGAAEACNGIDDNCNNQTDEGVQNTFYADNDNDGFGDAGSSTQACSAPAGYVANNTDCNDNDATAFPGQTWHRDADGDGYGDGTSQMACSRPANHYTAAELTQTFGDCNDANSAIHPGATETCNGIDDNCNTQTDEGLLSTFYADNDNDGYGDPGNTTQACSMPAGYVANNTDCDDNDAREFPGQTWHRDADGDGYGDGTSQMACSRPANHYTAAELTQTFGDCNDANSAIHPGATEACNGIDDNCNSQTDEGVQSTFYADSDNDGFGDANSTTQACSAPAGYVADNTDCNDNDAREFPGQTWHRDADGDGYGDGTSQVACSRPANHYTAAELTATSGDCNDANAAIHPGAAETCNGIDDNCNSQTDENITNQDYYFDGDGDGYGSGAAVSDCQSPGAGYVLLNGDCDDTNAAINPGATEACNGIDDNCNSQTDEGVQSTFYADNDNDGYGDPNNSAQACSAPAGYVTDNTDCNDNDAREFPGQTWHRDADGDGYGDGTSQAACSRPANHYTAAELTQTSGDCDDSNAAIHPGAAEACNGIDDNCNSQTDEGVQSTFYADNDNDGYGDASNSTQACSAPAGYVSDNTDCNDNDAREFPGQTWHRDADGDGYGDGTSQVACTRPANHYTAAELTLTSGDCDDNNAAIHPGAAETCNGIDDNCNSQTDENIANQNYYFDGDADGYGSGAAVSDCQSPGPGYVLLNGDCDDNNAAIHPGAAEACNGIDDNCNSQTDEGVQTTFYADNDNDGYGDPNNATQACSAPAGYVTDNTDCNDNDAREFPGQTWHRDADGDGYGDGTSQAACTRPANHYTAAELTQTSGDCDDSNAAINPGAAEACNGIDDNCNSQTDEGVQSTFYADNDNDGYGDPGSSTQACSAPAGYVSDNTDCNDNDAKEFPGQTWHRDADGDGYGDGTSQAACTRPANHYTAGELTQTSGDCDDTNAAIHPGAAEACNGIDDNCNSQTDEGVQSTFYADNDNDGFGDPGNTTQACSVPAGYVSDNTDCNDNDAREFPGQTWYRDADGDGYGDGTSQAACTRPANHYTAAELTQTSGDCNDSNAAIHPGATEACNGIDDNCNSQTDEGVQTTFYADNDNDGYGDPNNATQACSAPAGYVTDNTDCNDNDAREFPGQTWHRDNDGDGYGDGTSQVACARPANHYTAAELTSTSGDCDDANAAVNPGAPEACNGIDDNCNSQTDENITNQDYYFDGDGDGYGSGTAVSDCQPPAPGYVLLNGDCDDSNAAIHPGAAETCNGIDDNCNSQTDENIANSDYYFDGDGDGYGSGTPVSDCQSPGAGYVLLNGDCDDSNAAIHPGAAEACNGIDDNCNSQTDEGVQSTFYADNDNDGFGDPGNSTQACSVPAGYVANSTDCNDNDAKEFPGQTWHRDADGDGYGDGTSLLACTRPANHYTAAELTATSGDCNDANAAIHPGATESCNGIDDNCNSQTDEGVQSTFYADSDNDGFGDAGNATQACSAPAGYVTDNTDCNDNDAKEFPGQTWHRDADGDGYGDGTSQVACSRPANHYTAAELTATSGDCDDANAAIHPGATESCNGIDDNCNSQTDENIANQDYYFDGDGDGYGSGAAVSDCQPPSADYVLQNGDCDDNNAAIHPGAAEACNGVDDNCNSQTDEGVQTTFYADNDNDGFGDPGSTTQACSAPTGYVADNTDCNDNDAREFPGQTWHRDADGDGYGDGTSQAACSRPANHYTAGELTQTSGDCDDSNAAIHPGAAEACNGIDDNCNSQTDEGVQSTFYADNDNDGYGDPNSSTQACSTPAGYVSDDTDCNDNDAREFPGQTWHRDADGDGYGDGTSQVACTRPANHYTAAELTLTSGDCDDNNAAIHPGAAETCNGIDDNCNSQTDENITNQDYYFDGDADGYGSGAAVSDCQSPGAGYVLLNGDCDDSNAAIHPGAAETCNGIDDNCNSQTDEGVQSTFYADNDNDGFGDSNSTTQACSAPAGYVTDNTDCNDNDAREFPGQTWHRDADGDGYGDGTSQVACARPANHYTAGELTQTSGDCDDSNAAIHPGAAEACNGIDDNCNSQTDEGVQATFYADNDNDGYGDPNNSTQACSTPAGYVSDNTDCNDNDANEFPGQTWHRDADGDGYGDGTSQVACTRPANHYTVAELTSTSGDCDDTNAAIHPGAAEACNGIDDNCNSQTDENITNQDYYFDGDSDGYGSGAAVSDCQSPGANYVLLNGDCDDSNAAVYPGAAETCNGIDDNCNNQADEGLLATFYADNDNDGFGNPASSTVACAAPAGYVADNTDCNDNDANEFPGQTWHRDADGDGYGDGTSQVACARPANHYTAAELTQTFGDCNDGNAAIHPGAAEACNGIDDNCNTQTDEGIQSTFYADNDNDGFGDPAAATQGCSTPIGYVANNLDCDDNDANEFPGQTWHRDADGDGYGDGTSQVACARPANHYTAAELTSASGDCDDTNAAIHPGAAETCNGIDDNCNSQTDEGLQSTFYADNDNDGFGDPANSTLACSVPAGYVTDNTDCNDADASVGSYNGDADCDGVPTANDCDDNDPAMGSSANDMDCDGVPASADCDDNDPNIASYVGQACNDGDPNTFGETIQADCSCGGGSSTPSSVCSNITADLDDAEERVTDGRMDLNSSDLELGTEGVSQWVGLRFSNLNIPQGAQITRAYIQFQTDETNNDDPCNLTIYGQAADNASAFTNATYDISARPRTSGMVAWAPPQWTAVGDAGPAQQTPDLSALVQEIVNRNGYTPASSIAFIIEGTGRRVAESAGGNVGGPELCIEYFSTPAPLDCPGLSAYFGDPCDDGDITTINDTVDNDCNCMGTPTACTGIGDADGDGICADVDCDDDDANITTQPGDACDDGDPATINDVIGDNCACAGTLNTCPGIGDNDGDGICADVDCDDDDPTITSQIGAACDDGNPATFGETIQADCSCGGGSVDPESACSSITVSADDAEENLSTTRVDLNSSDLELGTEGQSQLVGLRFSNFSIPQGANIVSAHIQFQVDETSNLDPCNLKIYGIDADNTPIFTSANSYLSNQPRTSARVDWAPPQWTSNGAAGPDQRTPDLAAIIQEIVNRNGYTAGSSIAFLIEGTGRRVAESADGNVGGPTLCIDFFATPPDYDCPSLSAFIGDACDDGDNTTLNDMVDADCDCAGTPTACTGIGDADGDGICANVDCDDSNPNITTQPGDACNDGNPATVNDMLDANCNCAGTLNDCPGIGDADGDGICADVDCDDNDAGNTSRPGDACDDGDPNTIGETIQADCTCGGGLSTPTQTCSMVSADEDDAEEQAGPADVSSSDLELATDPNLGSQIVGMRFTGLNIPQGAVITSAHVQFTVDETENDNPCNINIYGQAADNPLSFVRQMSNIGNRARTTATVAWAPPTWAAVGDAGPAQRTPDLSAIIQEVVDRSGFTTNSAIVILMDGTGRRTAESFDGSVNGAPELCVEYLYAPLANSQGNTSATVTGRAEEAEATTLPGVNAPVEAYALSSISIHPNPATTRLNVTFTSDIDGEAQVRARDLNGRVVLQQQRKVEKGENNLLLTGLSLPSGVYFLQLTAGDETQSVKFVITED